MNYIFIQYSNMKSVQIQKIQNDIIEDVRNKLRYYVKLKFNHSVDSIHIFAKKRKTHGKYFKCCEQL